MMGFLTAVPASPPNFWIKNENTNHWPCFRFFSERLEVSPNLQKLIYHEYGGILTFCIDQIFKETPLRNNNPIFSFWMRILSKKRLVWNDQPWAIKNCMCGRRTTHQAAPGLRSTIPNEIFYMVGFWTSYWLELWMRVLIFYSLETKYRLQGIHGCLPFF